jgi:hypothetical protein
MNNSTNVVSTDRIINITFAVLEVQIIIEL